MKVLNHINAGGDLLFGNSLHIDFIAPDDLLSDELVLHTFITDLIDLIGMKLLEPLQLRYYKGRDFLTEGFSGLGFLDTSSISVHTSPAIRRVYLDVFSCKEINIDEVVKFIVTSGGSKPSYCFLKR